MRIAAKLTAAEPCRKVCDMAGLTIELPPHAEQTEFNLRRWNELLQDPELARVQGRIETDRHGHIIMSPPPAPQHGRFQLEIGHVLKTIMMGGATLSECPISTADGVKAADVAWVSAECFAQLGNRGCFPRCPEICVEILSPSNTDAEISEKMALYFDAGAREVWVCDSFGTVTFFGPGERKLPASEMCAGFPKIIELGWPT